MNLQAGFEDGMPGGPAAHARSCVETLIAVAQQEPEAR